MRAARKLVGEKEKQIEVVEGRRKGVEEGARRAVEAKEREEEKEREEGKWRMRMEVRGLWV